MRTPSREPFYFGRTPRLFGIYHVPALAMRSTGVVLCYPHGQEQIRAHRAFVALADQLAAKGFHTLRFDYAGTGDSEDGREAPGPEQWQNDIQRAVDELRLGCAVERIALMGLRLGASLMAQAAHCIEHVDTWVLWEPIVDGAAYLHELKRAHELWQLELYGRANRERGAEAEALGFSLPAAFQDEVVAMHLNDAVPPSSGQVLVVAETRSAELERWSSTWSPTTAERPTQLVEAVSGAFWTHAAHKAGANPVAALDAMSEWLCHVA